MWTDFPLLPDSASTLAPRIDALFWFLVGVSGFFTAIIFFLVILFAVKYRRRSEADRPPRIEGDLRLEALWSAVPLAIALVIFVWGARLFVDARRPPANAMEVLVVGKQWMWKIQHPTGHREINELHVPVGRPVKLSLASEDVIHSFFIPAFRIKQDVVPGIYHQAWFEATRSGVYHLFCAEYCGTRHSGMVGKVVVMEPVDYEDWLAGGTRGEPLEVAGERLYLQLGCITCHRAGVPDARGPALEGLFGKTVKLATGATALADEGYLRESILDPNARLVAGYQPIMPTYRGQVSEEGVIQLVAYLKSLQAPPAPGERKDRP